MELTLLGTCAAEGWPAPFCVCEQCQEARRRGGPNIRSRSGGLVDEDLKIDFCPDTVAQMQRTGRNLSAVRTILLTHQHSDHLAAAELEWASFPYTATPAKQPIDVYGNKACLDQIRHELEARYLPALSLHLLEPLKPITTATGDTVVGLPADHCEGAMVLRITRGGKTLFYGHDSGLYPPATLDALAAGPKLDIAVFDCTNGGLKTGNRGHMGVDGVIRMAEELRRRGTIAGQTRCIATHFSHNGKLMHEDLVRAFLPHGIEVAFDGMVVRV